MITQVDKFDVKEFAKYKGKSGLKKLGDYLINLLQGKRPRYDWLRFIAFMYLLGSENDQMTGDDLVAKTYAEQCFIDGVEKLGVSVDYKQRALEHYISLWPAREILVQYPTIYHLDYHFG